MTVLVVKKYLTEKLRLESHSQVPKSKLFSNSTFIQMFKVQSKKLIVGVSVTQKVNKWRKSGQYLISTRRAILKHPVWILEGVIRSTLAI